MWVPPFSILKPNNNKIEFKIYFFFWSFGLKINFFYITEILNINLNLDLNLPFLDPGVGPALEYSSLPSIVNLSCSVRQVIASDDNDSDNGDNDDSDIW